MLIHESAENYLEAILMLTKRNGSVRSIDIANSMGFSKPSVSVAMKNFRNEGFIHVDTGGYITLTKSGLEIAERVYERHRILVAFLTAIGVNEDTAREDACKIEHDLSQESFDKIKTHAEKIH